VPKRKKKFLKGFNVFIPQEKQRGSKASNYNLKTKEKKPQTYTHWVFPFIKKNPKQQIFNNNNNKKHGFQIQFYFENM